MRMGNLVNLLREIAIFIIDAVVFAAGLVRVFAKSAWEWFLYIPVSEKIIVINVIPAFLTASMDSGYFKMNYYEDIINKSPFIEFVKGVNNPYAAYIVCIAAFMIVSSFFRNKYTFAARLLINSLYLIFIIYLHSSGKISKVAPEEFSYTVFFYLNYAVSIINIAASLVSKVVYYR